MLRWACEGGPDDTDRRTSGRFVERTREVELVAGAVRMVMRGYPGVIVGGLHEGDMMVRELSDDARDAGLVLDVTHHPGETQCSVRVNRAEPGHV